MRQHLKSVLLAFVVAGVCVPGIGMAQEAKIAVVDVQALTLASEEGKTVNEKWEKRFQAISAEMDKTRKEIEAKENDLRTRERLMSAAAKTQLMREIDDAKRGFERKNQDYQKELSDLQNDLLLPVADKARTQLATYVQENAITLLIDLSSEKSNVVWFNPKNDVTAPVLKLLNDAYKKSGGVPAVPSVTPSTAPGATTPKPTTNPAPQPRPTTPPAKD